MKQIFLLVGILSTLLHSCSSSSEKGLTQNDITGTWMSSDGAVFVFNGDGTFTVKSFPAEFVLLPKEEYKNLKFDGTGKWMLRKGSANQEVFLDFKEVSDKKFNSAFPLLIAGEKGIMENKPPWYLFVWKGEEGGDRYEFHKK